MRRRKSYVVWVGWVNDCYTGQNAPAWSWGELKVFSTEQQARGQFGSVRCMVMVEETAKRAPKAKAKP